jgi:HEAT repeat protein
MDKYLIDLINRMNDTSDKKIEAGYDSSKTISWKAFREAENLDNKDFISQLIAFADNERDKRKRGKAYFILGHISKNIDDMVALEYLIHSISKEADKYIIASLLDQVANLRKPIITDLQPIIAETKSDKWLIRHSAIRALNNSADEIAETTLIEILNNSNDPFDLTYTNATLNKIGTPRAIPYLEKHLKSRKRDVKDSAKFAIEEINKRHG